MGEPARRYKPDIEPDIHPKFGVIQGGGESTPERGNLSSVAGSSSSGLSDAEHTVGAESAKKARHLRSIDSNEGVKNDEASRDNAQWSTNTGNMGAKQKGKVSWWRKKSATLLITLGLAGGGVGVGFIGGPATMLVNLMQNLTTTNDSSSAAMESRFMKVFGKAVSQQDPVCANNSKQLKCKRGRISNKALKKLERKGVYAVPERTSALGYPKKNPTSYRFVLDNGQTRTVPANELRSFLSEPENRQLASKVLGRGGAFNMRWKATVGKHIGGLYKKFGIKRNGGDADGKNKGLDKEERQKKVQDKIQTADSISSENEINEKVKKTVIDGRFSHAKKGGSLYAIAAGSCLALKVPKYYVAGVAAIMLAQALPVVTDKILSPGGKAVATAVEEDDPLTAEDIDTVATTLTEKTKDSDGNMTSALDSDYLKAALGINKNAPPPSEAFSPGFSALATFAGAIAIEKKTQKECDQVLSSEAMYAAMGLDLAATAATTTTGVGLAFKIGLSLLLNKIAGEVLEGAIDKYGGQVFKALVENDNIPKATGRALGDVIGIAAPAFFSAMSMARFLPSLTTDQLSSWNEVRVSNENFQREMDIASLSPFDTSSKYTFMGSLVNNAQMAMISSGLYSKGTGSVTAILPSVLQMAHIQLSANASAAEYEARCSYGDEFGYSGGVAATVSGLPCPGITEEQAGMSVDRAADLIINEEKWVDGDATVDDDATIQDLLDNDVIKKDTPLRDYIDQCGDASTGDYLVNGSGCSIKWEGKTSGSNYCNNITDSNGNVTGEECSNDANNKSTVEGVKNPESLAAIPVFLLDYQVLQSMNGEDDNPEEIEGGSSGTQDDGSEGGDLDFTVAAYNVCHEGNHSCPANKVDTISNNILGKGKLGQNQAFDVVATQETSQATARGLKAALSGYNIFPEPADIPTSRGKAIFWNSSVFPTLLDSGKLASRSGATLYDNGGEVNTKYPFPWVKLQAKSGQVVYILSVHSPPGNTSAAAANKRNQNAKVFLEWAKSKIKGSDLVVLAGDFNATQGKKDANGQEAAYCILTKNSVMQNAKDAAAGTAITKACPDAGGDGAGGRADQIYASTNIKDMKASGFGRGAPKDVNNNIRGTDHGPVWITYSIKGSAGGFAWPLDKKYYSQDRTDWLGPHTAGSGSWTNGVNDLAADVGDPPDGSPVYAIFGGTVGKADLGGHGLTIKTNIQGGILETAYAHGPRTNQKAKYNAGDKIMTVGCLGNCDGGHVHFDMAFNGKGVCPQDVFLALEKGAIPNFNKLTQKAAAPCSGRK